LGNGGIGGFKGTVTQTDRPEDLGDDCNVKMRSQAGLVLSSACERQQPSAPIAMGKPRDLKGELASSYSGDLRDGRTATMGSTFQGFALIKTPPPPPCSGARAAGAPNSKERADRRGREGMHIVAVAAHPSPPQQCVNLSWAARCWTEWGWMTELPCP
jgi:hypothetical protein